jgi:hypothetical protein
MISLSMQGGILNDCGVLRFHWNCSSCISLLSRSDRLHDGVAGKRQAMKKLAVLILLLAMLYVAYVVVRYG